MLRVLVCVSGGGTNLQAIIDAVANGTITNTQLVGVLSNNKTVKSLERAKNAGIAAVSVSPKDYPDRAAFNDALLDTVDSFAPDLIVLAGFLVAIPEAMVHKYSNRIINIHPSLIPSFCGVGYYGLKVHEQALKRGVKVTGATVHFVTEGRRGQIKSRGYAVRGYPFACRENDIQHTEYRARREAVFSR